MLVLERLRSLLDTAVAGSDPHAEIAAVLAEEAFFQDPKNALVRVGSGCIDIRPVGLAGHLVDFARVTGAAEALAALQDLVGIEQVATATYVYVEHVTTLTPVDLGNGVVAVPDDRVPFDLFRDTIGEIRGRMTRNRGAILVARQSERPFLRVPKREGTTPFEGLDPTAPGRDRIEIALRMMTVAGPASPAVRASTTALESPALRLLTRGVAVRYEYPSYWAHTLPWPIDDEPRRLVGPYLALPPEDRRRIDVAISRLRLAVARTDASEAIVDVAIALEAVLSASDDRGEITYRLRLRAALFLETGVAERERLSKLVRDIYKERSKVVHGAEPGPADEALRARGQRLVVDLIRKILFRGGLPDWPGMELAGGAG